MYIKSKLNETTDLSQINIFTSKEIKELREDKFELREDRFVIFLFSTKLMKSS